MGHRVRIPKIFRRFRVPIPAENTNSSNFQLENRFVKAYAYTLKLPALLRFTVLYNYSMLLIFKKCYTKLILDPYIFGHVWPKFRRLVENRQVLILQF